MARVKKCIVCGNIFIGRPNQIYCCAECREKARRKKMAEGRKKPKEEIVKPKTVQRKKKLSSLSIEQINRRARAEGLTYGQYVAKYS